MATKNQLYCNYTVGVISDTHGLLRREAAKALEGTDLIIHAGDIGKPEVLEALRAIAAVSAVRGNMDVGVWTGGLPETEVVEIGEVLLYVLHDASNMDLDPGAAGFSAVISGHTHRASIDWRGGVLYLNPGTAGPFSSPVSVAVLHLSGKSLQAKVIELEP
ncbi:MAG: metallophosphoesterase family protein [Deltaproteobacteria bacterium]|nr:MAG: metallophosphoesterase family protein [Deltaproteobacteria bacterium]